MEETQLIMEVEHQLDPKSSGKNALHCSYNCSSINFGLCECVAHILASLFGYEGKVTPGKKTKVLP